MSSTVQRYQKILLSTLAIASLTISSFILPAPAQADQAVKTASSTTQGNSTPVQIRIKAPTSVAQNIEVSFAIDASGSMASDINNAKTKIKTFLAWVYNQGYASRTTISVTSFSYLACSPESANLSYHQPVINYVVDRKKLTSATSLNSAINSIQASSICTNLGESSFYGFTDITAGLNAASGRFTTAVGSSTSQKFLVLMSDGYQNMPANGSGKPNIYIGTWSGSCPLMVNAGKSHINITRRYDQFFVVKTTNTSWANMPVPKNSSNFSGISPYVAPCHDYLTVLGRNLTASQFMNEMVVGYPNSQTRTIEQSISSIQNTLVDNIYINDYLNSSVFDTSSGSITSIAVVSCNTATSNNGNITGASIIPSGNRIYGTIPYVNGVSYYCIRFNAKTKTTAPTGSQKINSEANQPSNCSSVTGSHNYIRYRNAANTVLGCDTIGTGTVTIILRYTAPSPKAPALTSCSAATLSWTAGVGASSYRIIVKTGSTTVYDKSTTGTSVALTGLAPLPTTYTWQIIPTAGGTTRPAINGSSFTTSTCYSAPTSLRVENITCDSATLVWNAGKAYTRLHIRLLSGGSLVQEWPSAGAGRTSLDLTGLADVATTYTWSLTPYVDSTAQPTLNGPSFSTPHCRSFDTSMPGGTYIHPGDSNGGLQDVNITYRPNVAAWGSATLTVGVVGIVSGSSTCSSYTSASPFVTSGTGGAAGITARETSQSGTHGQLTFAANSRAKVVFQLVATDSTPQGTYTICIASKSSSGAANNPIVARIFDVRYSSWLQIDSPSVSRAAGDIHSNGSINFSIPFQKYLINTDSALITASGGNLTIPNGKLAKLVNWRVSNYHKPALTPTHEQLFSNAKQRSGGKYVEVGSAGSTYPLNDITAYCGTATTVHVLGDLNLIPKETNPITDSACKGPFTYIVEGDLSIVKGVIDNSNKSGVIFLVKGDITLNSPVTSTDGMYLFGGSFYDGGGNRQLTINGSLIGLSGHNPSSSAGSFIRNGQSGLQRDLGLLQNGDPSTIINYQPKYLEVARPLMGQTTITWTE